MLAKLRNRLRKNMLKNNRGQGATEYILLVAVVVGIVMVFGPKIKKKLGETTEDLSGKIGQSVQDSTKVD
ncbi:MAG: class III signal peptide-containing protein [Pseudobdellovibrio sp.]|uniref:class III signal peptide-containing protein n=1 Tax=Pseudobdellovibrio sp. HCB154 TaxID=3386277 RepID=UPI003916E41C|nr:class III signal peptide-containing protein [Pseudobdellovibrio sp.]